MKVNHSSAWGRRKTAFWRWNQGACCQNVCLSCNIAMTHHYVTLHTSVSKVLICIQQSDWLLHTLSNRSHNQWCPPLFKWRFDLWKLFNHFKWCSHYIILYNIFTFHCYTVGGCGDTSSLLFILMCQTLHFRVHAFLIHTCLGEHVVIYRLANSTCHNCVVCAAAFPFNWQYSLSL